MNQTEQMREALQAIEAVLEDAYHRHFAECCGRGQGWCCGDFIEQWTPEDHKILDTLSPIQRKLSQALAAEPAPLVRLTEEEIKSVPFSVSCTHIYFNEAVPDRDSCLEWANALQDAWIAKNGGKV